ncbi:hypothetical protein AB1Y20_003740 [Prymnesium parvum]
MDGVPSFSFPEGAPSVFASPSRPHGVLHFRSRRVRGQSGRCKECSHVELCATVQRVRTPQCASFLSHVLAYMCTAVGPAMGAATAAWAGESIRFTLGCQHASAVVIAAVCSGIAQLVATTIAAALIAIFGDSWRASVTPGFGRGDFSALGLDTRKLVRKQTTKAAVKSFASKTIAAAVGQELGVLATVLCAVAAAVTGGVFAAVSIEALHARHWSSRAAMSTAMKATYKTALKTAISSSVKEGIRSWRVSCCGPVMVGALSCGTGIALRNFIVDWISAQPSGNFSHPRGITACPVKPSKPTTPRKPAARA